MPLISQDLPNVGKIAFIPAKDITADANGTPIDLALYEGSILINVDIGLATAGTTPTLALVIKESSDNGNWTNSATTITGATSNLAATQVVAYDTRAHLRYARIDQDISGSGANYPLSVVGFGIKKYQPT